MPALTPSRNGFADEYPFPSRYFDQQGHRYHYIDEGQGEVVLCVHGNPTWSFAWRNVVKELSRDHRVLAVDHLGCGFSDKPQGYPYRLEQHVANLRAFVEGLDLQRVTLLAHDWGGAIGMGTAGRIPERFARLMLCNTAAFRSRRIPWRIAVCRWPIVGPLGVRGLNLFSRAALTMAMAHPERMTPAVKKGFLAPYGNWHDRVAIQRFVEDIPLAAGHPSYQTLVGVEDGLSRLTGLPLLLIWGERDWCFDSGFREEFQRRFPAAQVLKIEDAGHYVFEDAREEFVGRIRRFLQENPLRHVPVSGGDAGSAG